MSSAANLLLATQVLLDLIAQAQTIGGMIARAQAEGRDITRAELDQLAAGDDAARRALADAIEAAKRD